LTENEQHERAAKSVCSVKIQFVKVKKCSFHIKWPTSNRVDSLPTNITNSCKHIDERNNG